MTPDLPTPPTSADDDARWMREALSQAQAAAQAGEVPVGAVVVHQGRIVGRGYNQPVGTHDPSAHAEIQALRDAARQLGNYRLEDCTLYVTLEPCAMCAGAILHARVARVVWGAAEPRTGAGGSVINLFAEQRLNHHTHTTAGVLADEAAALLTAFFSQRRKLQQQTAQANHPLRDDALRTPEKCFSARCDCQASSFFYSNWPSLAGLRLHVKDSGAETSASAITWLMLAPIPAHQGMFRHLAAGLQAVGDRVVAPDWLGLGRSDKPKKDTAVGDAQQLAMLQDLYEHLDLAPGQRLVVVAHGDASRLALAWHAQRALASAAPAGLWLINPLLAGSAGSNASKAYGDWLQQVQRKPALDLAQALGSSAVQGLAQAECTQWQSAFPDKGFRAGLRAWARDAQTWMEEGAVAPQSKASGGHGTRLLLSGGRDALWWLLPWGATAESGALQALALDDFDKYLPAWAGGPVNTVALQRCDGGDWLPLQNPAALLAASAFFRV